jgi:superfamily II helicase
VYCLSLGLRPEQANEYAHMAGRAGRVGQAGRGVVTSVINADPDWVSVLSNLNTIVQGSLGRSLEAVAVPSTSEDTDKRRALDDLILLTKDDVTNESK